MPMFRIILTSWFVMVLFIADVNAASPINRSEHWEFYFQTRWIEGETVDLQGPAEVTISDENTFAFGFGYNFNNRLSLSGEFAWGSVSYTANSIDANGDPVRLGGTLDTGSTFANLTYYFSEKSLAPFVGAQMGWVFVDSNIPAGPPSNVCWWDPWWGYICSPYQPTYSETSFGYGVTAGLRWDGPNGFFVRGSIGESWIDFDSTSSAPGFRIIRFDIGSTF